MVMTLQQMQYLTEVSRTGSISKAAQNLFTAQSSVSTAISNLEKELGFPIFLRTKKGIVPTAEGALVLEQAARICESCGVLSRIGQGGKRHIRICAPSMEPLDAAAVSLIARYRNDDSVYFAFHSMPTPDAVRRLTAFELDAAVLMNHKDRFLSVETLLESKNLSWQTIGTLPVVVQIGPGHPLYKKETVEVRDLQDMLFVDNIHDPLVHNEYLTGILRLSPERAVSCSGSHTRNLLVAKGLAYSIGVGMPKLLNENWAIRSVPLKDVSYVLTAVTNPQNPGHEAVETYIRLVRETLSDLHGGLPYGADYEK